MTAPPDAITSAIAHVQDPSGAERLDETVQVTRTRAWLAVITIVVLTGGFLTWSVMAQIPRQFTSTAVVSNQAYGVVVAADQAGKVDLSADLALGSIAKGQVLGNITGQDESVVAFASPVKGQLLDVLVNSGQWVEVGTPLFQLSRDIQAADGVVLVTFVTQRYATALKLGDRVDFPITNVTTGETIPVTGSISEIAGSPADRPMLVAYGGTQGIADVWESETGGLPYAVILQVEAWPPSFTPVPPAGTSAAITFTYGYVKPITELLGIS